MTREKTQAELELQALAAIGEALLFNNRGNPQAVIELRNQGKRFLASNAVSKKLSELCHNAAHDPNWRVSKETRLRMAGGKAIEDMGLDHDC